MAQSNYELAGMVGALLRYITPLTISPAVAMIGLSLFPVAADKAAENWWISMGCVLPYMNLIN